MQDIAAYKPSTDSFAAEMDPVRLANEISPHLPADVEVDEHSDEGEGARVHDLWSTLVDGRNRRSFLDAMSADEIDIGEKVAAWDPSQEDNYALQSPGQLEFFRRWRLRIPGTDKRHKSLPNLEHATSTQ
ncbi:hypothetical protein MTO96_041387 [Rhipicephalus appendiculatus]